MCRPLSIIANATHTYEPLKHDKLCKIEIMILYATYKETSKNSTLYPYTRETSYICF